MSAVSQWFYPYRWWFIAAIGVGLLSAAARAPWIPYRQEHYCLYAFMGVSVISCLVSPMPEYSLARLATFVVMFFSVFIAGWVWLQNEKNVSVVVSLFVLAGVIGSLVCAYAILEQGALIPTARFTGAFGKATGTGSFAAGSLPLILWKREYSRGRWRLFYNFIILVLAYTLFFSGARAALAGGTAATAVWFWKHRPNYRVPLGIGGCAIAALFLTGILSLDILPSFIVRKESLNTFTGRIPRWQVGIDLFSKSPVLGHGYGMTRYVRLYEDSEHLRGDLVPGTFSLMDYLFGGPHGQTARMTLHSDQVERLLETGILGFIPFALFWYFIMSRVVRVMIGPLDIQRSLAIALALNVCYIFLDSFMHGALFALNASGTILSWLLIVLFMAVSDRCLLSKTLVHAPPARYPQH